MRTVSWRWLGGLASAMLVASAVAQNFPEKAITLVVPYSAGGTTDVAMRALAEATSKQLGQRVVVDNRTGVANGELIAVGRCPRDAGGTGHAAGAAGILDDHRLTQKLGEALRQNPADKFSSAQARWFTEPAPGEPYCILAWFAFA